ncbi:MAG: tetratricopeptide repeat protein [bacterium]
MKKINISFSFLLLVAFSFQFWGCGGADIQSAKLYRQQRDWRRADQMLQQALKSDPASDEGWALYMQNLYDLKQYEKIAELVDTARLYSIKNRKMVELVRQQTWVDLYNGGVTAYQQNPDSKEQQTAAIGSLESAKHVAPDQPETYEVLGDVYYSAGDTAKGIATYKDALVQVRSTHDQGVSLGLRMKMDPAEVESVIGGSPSKDTSVLLGTSDTVKIYHYRSNDGYFYFEKATKPPHKWQLFGWRFTNTLEVGLLPMRISVLPYARLGNYYYAKGNSVLASDKSKAEDYFNEAVPMYIAMQRLDPSDENASAMISDIYGSKLNDPDKARGAYENMIAAHPSKSLYTAYGVTLLKTNDYEGAVGAFEKAVALDPAYELALYDLGVTYKNWAAAEQKKNLDFHPKMEKSTDYFERVIAVNKKDYNSYFNLVENYDILAKKDKSLQMVTSLEAMKSGDATKDASFWEALAKIYTRLNRTADATDAFSKADKLRK